MLFIGTSGWIYNHWRKVFYPEDLENKNKLKYYSSHFKTTEINYSFYHLPKVNTFKKWYYGVPGDFIFAVKISRFITHIKRLKGVKTPWRKFLNNALNLKEKLGPILFQFPPSFKNTEENIKRIKIFFEFHKKPKIELKIALEFRHLSWLKKNIYNLLKDYHLAWVISDSPHWPRLDLVTTNFVYLRMHGSRVLFSSKYSNKELEDLAQKIKIWQKKKLDIFVYFNNDAEGYAVENAKTLKKLSIY